MTNDLNNRLQQKIKETIKIYFDEQIINNEELLIKSEHMSETILKLTDGILDWKNKNILLEELNNQFGDIYLFESQVHFYLNDRCVQLYVSKKEEKNVHSSFIYFFRISIFNYFQISMVNTDYFKIKNSNLSCKKNVKSTLFVDIHQNDFCDAVFDIIQKYYPSIIWLPSKILEKSIYSLNLLNGINNKSVTVADLLFRYNC